MVKSLRIRQKRLRKSLSQSFLFLNNTGNWRIRVREAVVAASDKPDMAFEWLSKVWAKESTEEQASRPGKGSFTLDAKVLSAITNVVRRRVCPSDRHLQRARGERREACSGVDKSYSGLMITLLRMPCMVRFTTLRIYWQLPLQTRISLCFLSNWETVFIWYSEGTRREPFLEPLFPPSGEEV